MNDHAIDAVNRLIELLEATDRLSASRENELYAEFQNQNRMDFFASEDEQRVQAAAIAKRQAEHRASKLFELWNRSLARANQDDLELHALLVMELFRFFLKTGETPPPASAWRIAVLLKKQKFPALEAQFLAAWVRHFGDAAGTVYEKLKNRYRSLGLPHLQ